MSKRKTHRTDHNEKEIVDSLRAIGCTVERIGRPVDLLVGRTGTNGVHNYLLECKNIHGLNKETPAQKRFLAEWRGQVRVVRSVAEAIKVVTESYGIG